MSAPETPNRAGGPSGCPVMLMMPESACAMRRSPVPRAAGRSVRSR
jgi:hypothetical protein